MNGYPDILKSVREYHTGLILDRGDSAEGVGWKNAESQELRFRVLADLLPTAGGFSLLDVGCGVGALYGFLQREGYKNVQYLGIDVSAASLDFARNKFTGHANAEFIETTIDRLDRTFDYVVSSGIFNLKLRQNEETWLAYVQEMIQAQFAIATKAAAFNCLSSYRDFSAPDLYYSDPAAIFDFCKRRLSPYVAVRHDYPLWEFTVYVYREPQSG